MPARVRNVVIENGEVVVLPSMEDIEDLKIGHANGKMYFATSDRYLFKLHNVNESYMWIGMWNSICCIEKTFKTMEEAIVYMLNDRYKVKQIPYSCFDHIY
jgi:hypothetical protein